jgi:hypothetical protein
VTDLSGTLLPRLLGYRLPDLDLGPQSVAPHYPGLSLLNLPASLCQWFQTGALPHPPLDIPDLDLLAGDARQIILALVDGLSFDRFLRLLDGPGGFLRPCVDRGVLAPISSLVPATTSTALTTLWTGRSPAEHAILGYELLLKPFGLVANMVNLTPASFEQPGLLERAGFSPESALPFRTLGTHLTSQGIEVHAFLPAGLRQTGLSRMHLSDVVLQSFTSASDLWRAVRDLVRQPPAHRRWIWIYYGELDTLSHRFGPDSDAVRREAHAFLQSLDRHLITQAPDGRDILMMLTSDHGQIATPPDPHFDLATHPSLTRRLHLLPTGENRLAYLYSRPGQTQAVIEYVEKTWPDSFRLMSSSHALQAGLFGPGIPDGDALSRLGDAILAAQGPAYLWWSHKPNTLLGRHGGLSRDEMIVPLLVSRLG